MSHFFLGRFLIGTLPIAEVLMTRLPENFCRSSSIMTPIVKYVLRGVKISVEFVDGQSGSKGVGMVGEGKFPFPITQLLLKIEKNPNSRITV